MKNKFSWLILLTLIFSTEISYGGNPDRVGQAGATELLINPWARSSGWNGAFTAGIPGVEAMRFNPAGIISIPNSEFLFSRTSWLSGADIFINSFGFASLLGNNKASAFGLDIMSFDFGDIQITTVDNPEGGLGTFSPAFTNIGLSYAYKFSERIRTGITFRMITESIPDAKASGFCFDAGLQYVTDLSGDDDKARTRFGVSLRNVGTPMKFSGDGLSRRGGFEGSDITLTVDTRSASFELPTLLNIGVAQDVYFDANEYHKLTFAGNFTSNSFSNDQINVGIEYSLRNIVMLRGGTILEKNIYDKQNRKNVFTGPAAGFSVNLPFGEGKNKLFGVDYSYRATQYFAGTHSFGARIVL